MQRIKANRKSCLNCTDFR